MGWSRAVNLSLETFVAPKPVMMRVHALSRLHLISVDAAQSLHCACVCDLGTELLEVSLDRRDLPVIDAGYGAACIGRGRASGVLVKG